MKNLFSTAFLSLFFFVLLISFSFNSCTRCQEEVNGEVEFYLLESFDTLNDSAKIDVEAAITKTTPYIKYSELLSYNKSKFEFELSSSAINKIKNRSYSTSGPGFAIKIDNRIIYAGYFWPSLSSATCDWIIINPLVLYNGNKLTVKLGYPNESFSKVTNDPRNDSRILDIFERDKKLID